MTDVTKTFYKLTSGTLSDVFFGIIIMELYSIGGLLLQKGFTDEFT
jgi:hypothetical protein